MKLIIIVLSSMMALAPNAAACEKHAAAAMNKEKTNLPGGSLYHLSSSWVNQNNQKQSLIELAGHPRLISMVFTRCQSTCPLLVQQMKSIEAQLPADLKSKISVDLFSFDAEKETPESMKAFLKKYKIDEKRWAVHASTAGDVAELAAALGVQYKKLPSGDYIHSNIIFLIGEKGEVIAKMEGLNSDDKSFVGSIKKLAAQP